MSFETKEAVLGKGKVQFRVSGQGQPLLYLHTAGGVRISPAQEQLASAFRVYIPTMPGFDGSATLPGVESMQDLAHLANDFAETEIGAPCDVLGHSFGGWLASWLAVLHPERVQQLVLAAPAGFRPEGQGGLAGTPEELRRRMFAHPERLPAEQKPADVQARNREMTDRYHGPVATDTDLLARVPEIACLTLIIQGTRDGVIPPVSGQLLRKHIPSSYLAYMYDAAHGLDVDQPDRFAALVTEFLTRGEAFIINWNGPHLASPTAVGEEHTR